MVDKRDESVERNEMVEERDIAYLDRGSITKMDIAKNRTAGAGQ